MKAPIAFVYGNCVFADGLDDCWAAFAVEVSSYEWLSEDGKRGQFLALLGALEAIEADVQILRVGRRWELARYAHEVEGLSDAGVGDAGSRASEDRRDGTASVRAHTRARTRYLAEHQRRLKDVGRARPAVFVIVSLRDPGAGRRVVRVAGCRAASTSLVGRAQAGVLDARPARAEGRPSSSGRACAPTRRTRAWLDFLPVRQARGVELQWLVRRAFCRGLGEPLIDGLHEPRALVFERNGEAVLAPLEGDVMRWMDGYVEHRGRVLCGSSRSSVRAGRRSWCSERCPSEIAVSGRRAPS